MSMTRPEYTEKMIRDTIELLTALDELKDNYPHAGLSIAKVIQDKAIQIRARFQDDVEAKVKADFIEKNK